MKLKLYAIAILLLLSVLTYAQPAQNRPYSIIGRVLDGDGDPVAGVRIQATLTAFRNIGTLVATTESDGSFTLGVPKPETYVLTFGKLTGPLVSTYNRFYYTGDEFRPEVVVEDNKPAPSVTLRFPKVFGTIRTTVLDAETGKPIVRPRIKLCRLQSPNYCYTPMAGDQPLPAISGGFIIQVFAEGYEDWYQLLSSGVPMGVTKDLQIALTKIAPSGQPVRNDRLPPPEIVFPADGADLYGFPRVTRLQWSPVVGAASYMIDIDGCAAVKLKEDACKQAYPLQFPNWAPTSGIEGTSYEFTFLGAQPGRWRLWAVDSEGRPGNKTAWFTFFYHQ